MKVLQGIRDPRHMTLEAAEELKLRGAYLEMGADGWIYVYAERNT